MIYHRVSDPGQVVDLAVGLALVLGDHFTGSGIRQTNLLVSIGICPPLDQHLDGLAFRSRVDTAPTLLGPADICQRWY